MKRGLSQVLFHFMPGKTFDNTDNNTIEKVTFVDGTEIDDLNAEQVAWRVYAAAEDWEGRSVGFRRPTGEEYIVQKPDEVYSNVFPLVFRCRSCGHVQDRSGDRDEMSRENVVCKQCGDGPLWQVHHVMICGDCSNIQQISVPECEANHSNPYIKLDDSAERYKNFRWVCQHCDDVIETGLEDFCNDCNNYLVPTVHRASQAYRVHQFKQVDIRYERDLDEDTESNKEFTKIALGGYFGVFDHPDDRIEDIMSLDEGSTEQAEEVRDRLNAAMEDGTIGEDEKDNIKRQVLGVFEESEEKKRILSETGELLRDDDQIISRNHLNYLRMLEEIQIDELDELPGGSGTYSNNTDELEQTLDTYGLDNIRLTTEFPILTAVYGYHRTFDDPDENHYPQLNAFRSIEIEGGGRNDQRRPIYAIRSETEAVVINLDPETVMEWLYENGLIDDHPAGMRETEIKAYIYNRMDEIGPYGEDEHTSEITGHVHGLLHSLSHELIQEAALLSGIERTSLAEFLFPESLSFVIYSNQSHSFTIGGLYTLVDRDLDRWLQSVQREGEYCVYDPVCAQQGGSCHACTHISEVGCQYFNQNLSRSYIFGDQAGDAVSTGYFEIANGNN